MNARNFALREILARPTSQEQKAVKTTAFDLQLNPISPGMGFHRPERARDVNFWVATLPTLPIALKTIGHSTFPSCKKQST
ncbi:MAG: hypothetical protein F9K25_04150 [Candidatus Contendobacter sp.]|nr:MAG: hypothetical protein F9K25_04150 [Candidatus Contendobacter sp.]